MKIDLRDIKVEFDRNDFDGSHKTILCMRTSAGRLSASIFLGMFWTVCEFLWYKAIVMQMQCLTATLPHPDLHFFVWISDALKHFAKCLSFMFRHKFQYSVCSQRTTTWFTRSNSWLMIYFGPTFHSLLVHFLERHLMPNTCSPIHAMILIFYTKLIYFSWNRKSIKMLD